MRKTLTLYIITMLALVLSVGCGGKKSEKKTRAQLEKELEAAVNSIGLDDVIGVSVVSEETSSDGSTSSSEEMRVRDLIGRDNKFANINEFRAATLQGAQKGLKDLEQLAKKDINAAKEELKKHKHDLPHVPEGLKKITEIGIQIAQLIIDEQK